MGELKMKLAALLLLLPLSLHSTAVTDDEPIERNPFDRKPPSKEEAEQMMNRQLKE